MTSASVLIVLLVGTVVGALVGLLLGGTMENWYLALLAGFLGSTIAVIIRNLVLSRGAGLGPAIPRRRALSPSMPPSGHSALEASRWRLRGAATSPTRQSGSGR